ncbi:putative methyltransferase [Prunus yedoensis var. nudiflora]|uniref:Putative methyltransferase n=1 Tax=Prunus yedoensis var. nudiflora TaxID=2094558 RepID=A0A314UBM4_PRUYE|nr:putative methyltransferase [Prunus yedoensis var. nudiflora]
MATALSSLHPLHQDFLCPKYPRLYHNSQFRTHRLRRRPAGTARPPSRFPSFAIRASSVVTLPPEWKSRTEESESSGVELLACPVCYEPLIRKGPPGLNLQAIYRSAFKFKPAGTELFRSPLVSFLYERGWRQNFNRSGFPGLDEEFKMAQDYFKSAEGGVLLDVSCGSGLFSRKFAKSGTYSGVVALDFSENMLRQCYDFLKKDPTLLAINLALVRADVSRLPFPSGSVGAVHAGAALHCWPSPSNAIAEISRILRSGGIFVGTTFLRYTSSTPWILRPLRERALQNYSYLTEEEIEDLCTSSGLINYSSKVQQSFIMFSAQKP